MFDEYHYVPVLKWKRGEQIGLQNVEETLRSMITPLIEIPPIPWDYENDNVKYSIEEYIQTIPKTILKSWGEHKPFFFDISLLEQDKISRGDSIIEWFFGQLCPAAQLIPVVSLNSTNEYLESIKLLLKKQNFGICLRIYKDDIDDAETFKNNVTSLISYLGTTPKDVDLIIDFEYISETPPLVTIITILNNYIFSHNEWRTISFISSSFPYDMSSIRRDSIETLNRLEWQLWETLLIKYKSGHIIRMPSFGDYGISNQESAEIDPREMNISGHLRYTIEDEYMIVKGAAVRDVKGKNGKILRKGRSFAQMRQLCAELIKKPEFYGEGFSTGDKYIVDCANEIVSTGNPETWRRVGTNHHLTLVARQLAKHAAI